MYEDVLEALPDIHITALDRLWSDHSLILLHVTKTDFGPSPFKPYNSWFYREGFDDLIKLKWIKLDETIVSLKEIKTAVWDCGSSKAHDPDASSTMPQGDNYSFLTLIPKGLHGVLSNAVGSGLIKGINIGRYNITLSHLFYANDVIITTDWSTCDPDNIIRGLESVSIRRIQGIGYGVLEFLGVGTTFDIFQNIHILYLQYGVLVFSGYGILSLFPLWSLVSAGTDTPYLP
ncbi:hypothetical protein Tco_1094182 [Tanacetum coccineum]|uniref:RNA-directed DNA polymerase, eukaryota n=1 Tax=Tanacetum coccineum TaxID=301880 RepID=A0ABQ5IES6_9ASTR